MNHRFWIILILLTILCPAVAWAEDMRLLIDARTWKNPDQRQIVLSILQAATENEKNVQDFFKKEHFEFINSFEIHATDDQGKEVFQLINKGKVRVIEGKIAYEPLEQGEKKSVMEQPSMRENGNKAIFSINDVIPPFYVEGRSKYRYLYLDEEEIDGMPVHKIQFYPVTSDPKLLKGVAYFDTRDYHIIRIDAQMMQNPPFVSQGSAIVKFVKVRENLCLFREMRAKGIFGFLFWQYHVELVSRREGLTFSDR